MSNDDVMARKQEHALQYWHEALNREFFNGGLRPAVIRIAISEELEGSGILAQCIPESTPALILFHYYPDKNNILETITILLHEMIHQYLDEYSKLMEGIGLIDVEKNGKHTQLFSMAAVTHGLNAEGKELLPGAREKISKMIDQYDRIMNIKIY